MKIVNKAGKSALEFNSIVATFQRDLLTTTYDTEKREILQTFVETRQDKTMSYLEIIQSYVHRLYPNNLKS